MVRMCDTSTYIEGNVNKLPCRVVRLVGINWSSRWGSCTAADTHAPLRSEAGSFGCTEATAMDLDRTGSQAELAPSYRGSGTTVSGSSGMADRSRGDSLPLLKRDAPMTNGA